MAAMASCCTALLPRASFEAPLVAATRPPLRSMSPPSLPLFHPSSQSRSGAVSLGSLASAHQFFGKRSGVVCSALNGGGEEPPQSREEAVQQAAASLSMLLEKALKRQGPSTVKQRKELRQVRVRVEIPVLDDSPASLLSLTVDLLTEFLKSKKSPSRISVFFGEVSALHLAREHFLDLGNPSKFQFSDLDSETDTSLDSAVVFVVAPKFAQASSLADVAKGASARLIVLINPEWSTEQEKDAPWGTLLSSFDVAYSYTPLAIQGFFTKTEGAVLKHVKSGAPGGRPWLIFVKDNDKFKCVSSHKSRPDVSELEGALYNSLAANSPVTKSVKFLRGLVTKQ